MEKELKQEPANCLKVVLFGPESTGKSTMAQKLATQYNTNWVPEYMREFLQKRGVEKGVKISPADIILIARGQIRTENLLAKTANKILICDTDLLELKVYSEAYYNGYCNPDLLKHALNNRYDLYFLTNIDIPWVPDGLRDKPNDREGMFKRFKSTLLQHKKPFVILQGDEKERLETAVNAINELLKRTN